jgi:2-amino-4-hydroxy-6-hydroxymethyldihydropteridine diphosphokinase
MNTCYLSLGSNQKFPERQLRRALQSIKALPATRIIKRSRFYWFDAWGLKSQQRFCNLALCIQTRLPPLQLLQHCQQIEHQQGRVRRRKWGPRTLDIDIILYGKYKMQSKILTLPHPYFLEREFVLVPLRELQPMGGKHR